MEAVNGGGVSLGEEKGGPPPPSPLTGCYLLVVVGEPHSPEHKDIILQRIAKGLLSWDVNDCLVNLEKELAIINDQALEGEEARYGERLIQFASENLVTEILIHPAVSTLSQCVRNLLSSFTRHRHIIHAGYTFQGNGSWALQDGTFSYTDFSEAFQEIEVQRVIHAYENGISIHLHCSPEGDWTRLPKESFAKACKVRVNPTDVLTSGSPFISNFIKYLAPFLIPTTLEQILESSDVVGNIRFSRPTLYVFPGGQGDAALFGINGFNMLLDGGYSRKACFWDFVRHLDRLDAVLMSRLNNSSISGISSVLKRKKQGAVYPQIGHFFCNIQERKLLLSPDGDKDRDPLIVSLLEEGQSVVQDLRQLNLSPQTCYRDNDPVILYHKVGHGTLNMYVLSPDKNSREVREFLQKWNQSDPKLFAGSKSGKDFTFPLQNMVSICALLVWQPANPNDTITRILYPGSTPQKKILEGFDKLKSLECIKHPICSEKSLAPVRKTKQEVIEKVASKERIIGDKRIENKILNEDLMKNGTVNGDIKEKTVKKSDSIESDKEKKSKKDDEPKKIEDVGKISDEDKPKPRMKTLDKVSKAKSESHPKKKPVHDKKGPTTPKKILENKTNSDVKEKKPPSKPSPSATPAKSTKDANNRKVIENKRAPHKKEPVSKPAPITDAKPKPERKPISRRPKAIKGPQSPVKKMTNGVQKPDSISRRGKLDKEGTTDSSTVSTPSADQESILKKDISKLTPDEIQLLKERELKELQEEQEAVNEIEAVFRKNEKALEEAEPGTRKIKETSIDDKLEAEEYLIIEKEEVEHDSLDQEAKEDEMQKLARDSEESEKQRKLSSEEKEIEVIKEQKETSQPKDEVSPQVVSEPEAKKLPTSSPEQKDTPTTDKKELADEEVKEVVESHPEEKISATMESGATTTAPTLPEDERITLDEIKEDNGQIIEEKHVKEETKEKEVPIIQLPPKSQQESQPKQIHVVGIPLDKQKHIRDIVKTPDEVADLPVHEEADYHEFHADEKKTNELEISKDIKKPDKDETKQTEKGKPHDQSKELGKEVEEAIEAKDLVETEKMSVLEKSELETKEKVSDSEAFIAQEKLNETIEDEWVVITKDEDEAKEKPVEEVKKDETIAQTTTQEVSKKEDLKEALKDDTVIDTLKDAVLVKKEDLKDESIVHTIKDEVFSKQEGLKEASKDETVTDSVKDKMHDKKEELKDESFVPAIKDEAFSTKEDLKEAVKDETVTDTIKDKVHDKKEDLKGESIVPTIKDEVLSKKEDLKEVLKDGTVTDTTKDKVHDKKEDLKDESIIHTIKDEVPSKKENLKDALKDETVIDAIKDEVLDKKEDLKEIIDDTTKDEVLGKKEHLMEASKDEVLDKKEDLKEALKDEAIVQTIKDEVLGKKEDLKEALKDETIVQTITDEVLGKKEDLEDALKDTVVCDFIGKELIHDEKERSKQMIEKEKESSHMSLEHDEHECESDNGFEFGKDDELHEEIEHEKVDIKGLLEEADRKASVPDLKQITLSDKVKKGEDTEDIKISTLKEATDEARIIDNKLQELKKTVGDSVDEMKLDDITTEPDETNESVTETELKEEGEIIAEIDDKLQSLKQTIDDNLAQKETIVVETAKTPEHVEEVTLSDSSPEEEQIRLLRELDIDKLELGRKSPAEREEDVKKIVASVAEVLKSEAPLEELQGKLAFTQELRETHITTQDSPMTEKEIVKIDDIPPIPEEQHIEEPALEKSKRKDLIADARELMAESSKMISGIKGITDDKSSTEDKDDKDEDSGIVHRMLVTASSEDGGEEIEICPAGTITFSRSSESSGRSSPEHSQKTTSQKSSIVETTSDTISTVKQMTEKDLEITEKQDDVFEDQPVSKKPGFFDSVIETFESVKEKIEDLTKEPAKAPSLKEELKEAVSDTEKDHEECIKDAEKETHIKMEEVKKEMDIIASQTITVFNDVANDIEDAIISKVTPAEPASKPELSGLPKVEEPLVKSDDKVELREDLKDKISKDLESVFTQSEEIAEKTIAHKTDDALDKSKKVEHIQNGSAIPIKDGIHDLHYEAGHYFEDIEDGFVEVVKDHAQKLDELPKIDEKASKVLGKVADHAAKDISLTRDQAKDIINETDKIVEKLVEKTIPSLDEQPAKVEKVAVDAKSDDLTDILIKDTHIAVETSNEAVKQIQDISTLTDTKEHIITPRKSLVDDIKDGVAVKESTKIDLETKQISDSSPKGILDELTSQISGIKDEVVKDIHAVIETTKQAATDLEEMVVDQFKISDKKEMSLEHEPPKDILHETEKNITDEVHSVVDESTKTLKEAKEEIGHKFEDIKDTASVKPELAVEQKLEEIVDMTKTIAKEIGGKIDEEKNITEKKAEETLKDLKEDAKTKLDETLFNTVGDKIEKTEHILSSFEATKEDVPHLAEHKLPDVISHSKEVSPSIKDTAEKSKQEDALESKLEQKQDKYAKHEASALEQAEEFIEKSEKALGSIFTALGDAAKSVLHDILPDEEPTPVKKEDSAEAKHEELDKKLNDVSDKDIKPLDDDKDSHEVKKHDDTKIEETKPKDTKYALMDETKVETDIETKSTDKVEKDQTKQTELIDEFKVDDEVIKAEEKQIEQQVDHVRKSLEDITQLTKQVTFDTCKVTDDFKVDQEVIKQEEKKIDQQVEHLKHSVEDLTKLSEDVAFGKCKLPGESKLDEDVITQADKKIEAQVDKLRQSVEDLSKLTDTVSFDKCKLPEDFKGDKEVLKLEEKQIESQVDKGRKSSEDLSKLTDEVSKHSEIQEVEFKEQTKEDQPMNKLKQSFEDITKLSEEICFGKGKSEEFKVEESTIKQDEKKIDQQVDKLKQSVEDLSKLSEEISSDKCKPPEEFKVDKEIILQEEKKIDQQVDKLKHSVEDLSKLAEEISFDKCKPPEDFKVDKEIIKQEKKIDQQVDKLKRSVEDLSKLAEEISFDKCKPPEEFKVDKEIIKQEEKKIDQQVDKLKHSVEDLSKLTEEISFDKCKPPEEFKVDKEIIKQEEKKIDQQVDKLKQSVEDLTKLSDEISFDKCLPPEDFKVDKKVIDTEQKQVEQQVDKLKQSVEDLPKLTEEKPIESTKKENKGDDLKPTAEEAPAESRKAEHDNEKFEILKDTEDKLIGQQQQDKLSTELKETKKEDDKHIDSTLKTTEIKEEIKSDKPEIKQDEKFEEHDKKTEKEETHKVTHEITSDQIKTDTGLQVEADIHKQDKKTADKDEKSESTDAKAKIEATPEKPVKDNKDVTKEETKEKSIKELTHNGVEASTEEATDMSKQEKKPEIEEHIVASKVGVLKEEAKLTTDTSSKQEEKKSDISELEHKSPGKEDKAETIHEKVKSADDLSKLPVESTLDKSKAGDVSTVSLSDAIAQEEKEEKVVHVDELKRTMEVEDLTKLADDTTFEQCDTDDEAKLDKDIMEKEEKTSVKDVKASVTTKIAHSSEPVDSNKLTDSSYASSFVTDVPEYDGKEKKDAEKEVKEEKEVKHVKGDKTKDSGESETKDLSSRAKEIDVIAKSDEISCKSVLALDDKITSSQPDKSEKESMEKSNVIKESLSLQIQSEPKKLSISDVEISIKSEVASCPKNASQAFLDNERVIHEQDTCDAKIFIRPSSESEAGSSAFAPSPKTPQELSGKTTPPTVPVSPIGRDLKSPPSKLDSGLSEQTETDDDDLSTKSQVAHSQSDLDELDMKMDPMSMSFYGTLPGDSQENIPATQLYEITQAIYRNVVIDEGEDQAKAGDVDLMTASFIGELPSQSSAPEEETHSPSPSYLYEVTKAKYNQPKETDVMSASFIGELPSVSGLDPMTTSVYFDESDPIASWGKPLGLPSPAPPNNNDKGTPKKEKKLPAYVTAKNKLNDDKKRAESPSKMRSKKISPVYVDLTYVPHHGNHYYSYVDFFKKVRARYYVFSGLEPSKQVYDALLEAKQTWEDKDLEVTIIPTYDTDILGYWIAENEDLLSKYKIDLSPSASRCTINLQDHETSCSAYRLEF